MASSVYLETTIPSYLTAWRSPELAMAAKQQTTRIWWDERRVKFDLFISDAVLLESASGDPDAAKRRLEALGTVREITVRCPLAPLGRGQGEGVRKCVSYFSNGAEGIPVLAPKSETDEIVELLIKRLALPDRAIVDAAHIAICIVHGIDYLLSTVREITVRCPLAPLGRGQGEGVRKCVSYFSNGADLELYAHCQRNISAYYK